MTAPAWFNNAIITGLQSLVALSLPDRPAAEVMPATVTIWVEVLWRTPIAWDEELDSQRIDAAFLTLAGTCERWPVPKALLKLMPDRPAPLALPPPAPTPPPPGALEKLRSLANIMRLRTYKAFEFDRTREG